MTARARSLISGLVLLTAALAGCMGGEDVSDEAEDLDEANVDEDEENLTEEPDEPELQLSRTWHNGTVEGGAFPTGGWYCNSCENTVEFQVPDGAEAIHVEAAWQEDPNAYLNVSGPNCESYPLFSDYCRPGDSADGASPLSVAFQDDRTNETGTWTAAIWVDETTPSQIQVTIVATIVEQGELPNQYSALDEGAS